MGRLARAVGVGIAVAAVAGSYAAVRTGQSTRLDAAARDAAERHRMSARADRVVGSATDLGSLYGLVGVVITLTAAGKHRTALDVGLSGMAAWGVAQGSKPLLDRQRPYELGTAPRLVSKPAGSSWPSGHSAVVAAMAWTLSSRLDSRGKCAVWSVAAAVGFSRIQVGVHHLTDVVAGWGMGALCAAAWQAVARRGGHRR